MTSGSVSIVFNGKIYNYVELREELKTRGHTFDTTSDTEVILQLYLEYGDACVKKLNGMFAFLLYDTARRRILAARDHFGIKPLYYFAGNDCILFASEIKALLEHPAVSPEPDYDSIYDYLTFQYVLGDATLFKNIHKLEPGHYQVIDLDSMSVDTLRYWEPDFSVDLHHTETYFIYQLQNLLVDTIKLQLRSDVPVGAYLSGGMDSSIVTMLAAEKYPGRIKTFTGAFREGRSSMKPSMPRRSPSQQRNAVWSDESDLPISCRRLTTDEPAASWLSVIHGIPAGIAGRWFSAEA
jgi:asparagine synthase (glutamine-hydrolysing)